MDRSLHNRVSSLHAGWINDIARRVHNNAKEKGFYDGDDGKRNVGEMIALMHSELSEALECYRKKPNARDEHCPEHMNLTIELADCIIRILDTCSYLQLDIGAAIVAKCNFNTTRPYKHGKSF